MQLFSQLSSPNSTMKLLSLFALSCLLTTSLAVPTPEVNNLASRGDRKKIEDAGLVRQYDQKWHQDTPKWFTGEKGEMKTAAVIVKGSDDNGKKPDVKALYQTNKESYIVFAVNTEGIDIKGREILIDNYIVTNGEGFKDLKGLKDIGIDNITNEDAKKAIDEAWKKTQGDKKMDDGGDFEVEEGEDGWKELKERNPFIEGIEKLLKDNEDLVGDDAKIDKVKVIVVRNFGVLRRNLEIAIKRD